MFKIAMIDDNSAFLELIKTVVDKYMSKSNRTYEIQTYSSPAELEYDLEADQRAYYDLYLLDIEMPGVSGLKLAGEIRRKYSEPYIIFVTAHDGYSVEGYKYRAFYYVIKSRLEEMLPEALELVMTEVGEKTEPYYVIENAQRYQKVYYKDVYYIDVEKKYTYFHTADGTYSVRESLKNVCKSMSSVDFFAYADQNCLVNLRHVINVDRERQIVILRDKTEIWINRSRRKELEQSLLAYWRKQ